VVISLAFSAVSWAWRGRVRRGIRQRRGMNFMANSYMDWKEKGKGFLWGQVQGSRWKVELLRLVVGPMSLPSTSRLSLGPCFYL
jgi:hypothetical protein